MSAKKRPAKPKSVSITAWGQYNGMRSKLLHELMRSLIGVHASREANAASEKVANKQFFGVCWQLTIPDFKFKKPL